jgi:hypothetical protein
MKIKSIIRGINFKFLRTFLCLILGIVSLSECSAQSSVVGKWKEMSVKQFYSPEYVKRIGKPFIEGGAPSGSGYHWELKADHTYIIEDGTSNGKSNTSAGEWSVSGNQLTMRADAQVRNGSGGQIYTFVITGNKMTRTQIMLAPYNEVVIKQEDTSERM